MELARNANTSNRSMLILKCLVVVSFIFLISVPNMKIALVITRKASPISYGSGENGEVYEHPQKKLWSVRYYWFC